VLSECLSLFYCLLPHALTEMNRIKQQVQDRCDPRTFSLFSSFFCIFLIHALPEMTRIKQQVQDRCDPS
jgi:hypothetical protein